MKDSKIDFEAIKAVISFMREQGVSSFKLDNLEVTFAEAPSALPQAVSMEAPPTDPPITDEQRAQEEDDLLFHSSG